MANNGSFNTNGYESRYLTFEWHVVSQSVEKNQTTIQWTLKGAGSNPHIWYMSGNFKVVIDGATVYSSATRMQLMTGTKVASGTYTFNHDSVGNKRFSASAEAGIYYFAVNARGNGSWTLPTIARATQPSTNKNTYAFGESVTIQLQRASNVFTHTIQASVDGQIGFTTVGSNAGSSYTWQIPKNWARYLTNTNQRLRLKAITYLGGQYIGEREVSPSLIVTPTSDMKPVVSLALTDENRHKDTYGGFVRGQSRIKAVVNERLYEGTTVVSRTLLLNGVTYTTQPQVSELISSTQQVVTASVRDARGLTGEITDRPTVFDWYTPRITHSNISRCLPNGTRSETGSHIKVEYRLDIANVNNKNRRQFRIGYKKQSESQWRYQQVSLTSYSQSGHVVLTIDGEHSWDIQLEVSDAFSTYVLTEKVGTVYVLMDFHQSGRGIAIGKVSELENTLDINSRWNLKLKNATMVDFVVEEGYLNGWRFRKWQSGIAECWQSKTLQLSVLGSWGAFKTSGPISESELTLPFAFKAVPTVTVTLGTQGAAGIIMAAGGSPSASTTKTGMFEVTRGTTATNIRYVFNYYVIGNYK